MLTTEQLLYPRYKVTAPWPGMEAEPFRLQQIVTLQPSDDGFIHIPIKHIPGSYMRQGFFDMFPHLFQPLPWWSDREPEDMPEFVKTNPDYAKPGLTFKVKAAEKFVDGIGLLCEDGYSDNYVSARYFIPATLADYEAYNQQKEGMR